LETYANIGLRTLVLAKRTIPKEEYEAWVRYYMQASCLLKDRDNEMAKLQESLEVNLDILGATAIEDKLQDEVGETIASFKEAGIKVWVLTGDKVETAINIGYSCKLLDKAQEIFLIDCGSEDEFVKRLEDIEKEV
jgi:magnesium-transporting ATPase (P-type)